jgi:hypothetical protein
MKKVSGLAAVSAVILAGAFSGIVGANAVSSAVIYGCVSKTGTLSKVSTKSPTCPRGTTKLSWGTKGIAGLQGIQGLQGPQGATGPAGPQGPAGSGGGGGAASAPKVYVGTNSDAYTVQGANTGWMALTPMATLTNLPSGTYEVETSGYSAGQTNKGVCAIYLEPGMVNHGVMGFGTSGWFSSINGTSILSITGESQTITLGCSGDGESINVSIHSFLAKPITVDE